MLVAVLFLKGLGLECLSRLAAWGLNAFPVSFLGKARGLNAFPVSLLGTARGLSAFPVSCLGTERFYLTAWGLTNFFSERLGTCMSFPCRVLNGKGFACFSRFVSLGGEGLECFSRLVSLGGLGLDSFFRLLF